MDARRFDALTRALGRPASRRGALGVLAGALGLLGTVRLAHAQEAVTVCEDGETLMVPESAAQALLAHGARSGPCASPGAGGGASSCVRSLDAVCTSPDVGGAGCCDPTQVCTPTISLFITACQRPCATDADCAGIPSFHPLLCQASLTTCPFLAKCCVRQRT